MFWMTWDSPTFLSVFNAWVFVNAHTPIIISCSNECSVLVAVNWVNIGTISSEWEHSHHIPSKFASWSFPKWWMSQDVSTVLLKLPVRNVVVLLTVSLINSSEVFWIFWPIHGGDSWRMDEVELLKHLIFSFWSYGVDVNCVIMPSHSKILAIWRIPNDFTPLFWRSHRTDFDWKIIVIKDWNISLIVANCNMSVKFVVCDSSCLLMWRIITKSRGRRFDLIGLVRLSFVQIQCPHFSRS